MASVTLATIFVLLNATVSAACPAGPLMKMVPAAPCPVLLLAMVTGAAPLSGKPSSPMLLRNVRTSKVMLPALPPPLVEALIVDPLLRLTLSA